MDALAGKTAVESLDGQSFAVHAPGVLWEPLNFLDVDEPVVGDGDSDRVIEKTDFWTFSRPLRSRNPNWTLVATHSP